jgi:transglutaminase-like putative cysteine protease
VDPSASEFLQPAPIVDADHPDVQAFARQHGQGGNPRERAIALYYAVRDGFRYDPYAIDVSVDGLRASSVLRLGHGWCVTKAALLAAGCRALGIPAKVGFADVRNHLSTERMRRTMQTDVFYWHGYTAILLDGQWVKATPAFNIELCERFHLKPLEFDGREDSIYHPYDLAGNRHMEYLAFRGEHLDVPWQEMRADFERLYPTLPRLDQASFDADVAAETTR